MFITEIYKQLSSYNWLLKYSEAGVSWSLEKKGLFFAVYGPNNEPLEKFLHYVGNVCVCVIVTLQVKSLHRVYVAQAIINETLLAMFFCCITFEGIL